MRSDVAVRLACKVLGIAAIAAGGQAAIAADGRVDLPRFPSISPDGTQIVFSWRGDLWKVSAAGGQALRLTADPGDDLHSAWSPDGARIAFDSDRRGALDLFRMNADGTDLRQVTRVDRPCILHGFGVNGDGEPVLVLTASIEGDIFRSPRPYMVSLDGGDLIRIHDAFGSEPAISPDGTRVAFTRGGSSWSRRHYQGPDNRDLWLFNRTLGSFTRLTNWSGNDGLAAWAGPDSLLLLSDRELNCVNVYRMTPSQGEGSIRRLTSFTGADVQSVSVAAGGSMAVLMSWDALYTLDLRDAKAAPRALAITAADDEADNETWRAIGRDIAQAALSPDGKVMAYVAYGEVYVRHVDDKSPVRRVTDSIARERDIAWSADGLRLFFTSDRDGTESIHAATVAMTRLQIKEEFRKATRGPDEAPVAEPAPGGAAEPEPAAKPEPAAEPAIEPAAAPSPDQSPPATEPAQPSGQDDPAGSDAEPEVKADKDEPKPAIDPKRWHDAVSFTITPVVQTIFNDRDPSPSPDGKHLAFRRGLGDLMVADLITDQMTGDLTVGEPRRLAEGWDPSLHWRWSPDSSMIAYVTDDLDFNADVWIVPVDGGSAAVNVTRHPNNDGSPRWSADGRILSFLSERVDDQFDVWMVYLDKSLEAQTPREMDEYYKKAAEAAKKRKPITVGKAKRPAGAARPEGDNRRRSGAKLNGADEEPEDKADGETKGEKKDAEPQSPAKPPARFAELSLDDAYLRLRRITSLVGSEANLEMTPAGDRLIFSATIGDAPALYSVKWDGSERKQITGNVRVQHLTLTGDKVVFLAEGRAGAAPPGGGAAEYFDIADRIRIDLSRQASQKFLEAARILGEQFYEPTMNGVDWSALTQRYHDLARQTRTAHEFNDVANRFLGELNASHLGIAVRDEPATPRLAQGRLGTMHRRVRGNPDGYEILAVVAESPAAMGDMALQVGDVITAVEQQPFAPAQTLESALEGRVGKETAFTIIRVIAGQPRTLHVLITPIGFNEEQNLKHKAWRRQTAARVDQWSGGKLGYIHIEGMSQPSLDEFERDLYAAAHGRAGLIIDVRNNGGGWTTDRLLSSIMVQPHAYTLPRGAPRDAVGHYPQDRLFIQRYTLPMNLLCNEKSFSNAEIISHAFKTLKRGTLVGQQTYGGVISTGGTSLIDGTTVRLPLRGWFLPDGRDMERNGAMPNLLVPQTPEAESRDDDVQLKAAVDDLLKRVQ